MAVQHGLGLGVGAVDREVLVPVDFEGAYYFARVPVIEATPSGVDAATDYVAQSPTLVAAALREHPACIYRGHGVYAWGATLDQAYKWSSSVEAAARIAWLARIAGVQPKR